MKIATLTSITGVSIILMLSSACSVMYPQPLEDANATLQAAEAIPYYGNWFIFEEKNDPLRVKILVNAPDEQLLNTASEYLESNMTKYNALPVRHTNESHDIAISSDVKFNEITQPPQCRMDGIITFTIYSNGERIVAPVEYKIEAQNAFDTKEQAKVYLKNNIHKPLNSWLENSFSILTSKQIGNAILRVKLSRDIIELNPVKVEQDIREIMNLLRKTNGIRAVRTIELNNRERIASFRILFERQLFPCGLTKEINKKTK